MSLFFDDKSKLPGTAEDDYLISRLANYQTTPEGALLPPLQRGEFNIPFVVGLQVVQVQAGISSTTFTIVWKDIDSDSGAAVDHYNIYYTLLGTNTQQPVGPFSALKSPAQITITADTTIPVTFLVQTVLTNGAAGNLDNCASCTSQTQIALIQEENVAGGFLTGMQIQAPSTTSIVAYTPAGADTLVLSTTGDGTHTGGGLISVAARIITPKGTVGGITVYPAIYIRFATDGLTATSIKLIDAGISNVWNAVARSIATVTTGDSTTAGDHLLFQFSVGFKTELKVWFGNDTLGGGVSDAGQYAITALYATKTS